MWNSCKSVFPLPLRMGTTTIKLDKDPEEEGKQRRVNGKVKLA